jgi:hypothetical protein
MNRNNMLSSVLNRLLRQDFPDIEDIKVVSYENEGKYYYTIFLGINPDIVRSMDFGGNNLKVKTRELFNYIYPHDNLLGINFFNPNSEN